jgi:DNA-binding NtrC family response regulator
MKRLVVLARGSLITPDELSPEIQCAKAEPKRFSRLPLTGLSLKAAVAELEQRMLQEALKACGFNQTQASKRLGLSRQGLIKKLKHYGVIPRAGTS